MSGALYKDSGYVLGHLVEEIKHGNIALPDIQRPFVWSSAKVRDLFDSMYRGYPIGTLMFWETGAEVGVKPIGGGEAERVAAHLVIDGQQRLTSIYAVMTGNRVLNKAFEAQLLRIAFRPADQSFWVTDAAIEKDSEFLPNISVLWTDRYKAAIRSFVGRLDERREGGLSVEERDRLEERLDRVRDLWSFQIHVIELNAAADEGEVAEIFVRINSEGVQLNQSDFILTLMSVHWEKGRQQLEEFCRSAVDPTVQGPSPKNPFIDPSPDQLLRAGVGLAFRRGRLHHVYNILRGKDLVTREVSEQRRLEQFQRLRAAQDEVLDLTNWHEFLKCLPSAGFRSRRMITSETTIIYTYLIWLVGRCEFRVPLNELRSVIARWFFMAQATGRYTGSPESQIEQDLGRLRSEDRECEMFVAELNRIIAANFTGDYWEISFPNFLDTAAARSPALYAYYAALNLLDADLLFSSMKVKDMLDPNVTAPRSIERHHLFPRAWLEAHGIRDRREVSAIGNMAFIDWPENITIGARDPRQYWETMTARMPPTQLEKQRFWHALPIGWTHMNYRDFVERRRHLMAQVVKAGYETLLTGDQPTSSLGVEEMLSVGESETIEFKSTARWNLVTGQHDKKMEQIVVKTVCGFLNAGGGTLLIGVNDEAIVLGLDNDYKTLSKPNADGYELFLRQRLDTDLSFPTAGLVKIRFETIRGVEVCIVSVGAAPKPVFAAGATGAPPHEFWVRVGNATKQLHGTDMLAYQDSHWG